MMTKWSCATDVITVINYINSRPTGHSGAIPEDATNVKPFRDVDKDNYVTASDVLAIINYINAGLGSQPATEFTIDDEF